MHINCPHCNNGIEVVEDAPLSDVLCPSCGSQFSLLGDETARTGSSGSFDTKMIGRFVLIEEVGWGSFGSVWRGLDPELDRQVAVKIPRKGQLDATESETFFREARAAAQLKHANIVPVHEIGKDGETIYIVSDFVNGVTLADRLTSGQPSMRESAGMCVKISRALHHAHEKGVIHRDLKPGNIMLDNQGEPHLMDFGLAKRDAGEITITVEGRVLGTPAYMSPEQAAGHAHTVNQTTDVYSTGVILFEMLTGELPFRGNTRMMLHQVINEDAPNPLKLNSNIDKDLATISTKCMEKDPDKRYAGANDLADDLQRYLDGQPITARPISSLERGWRWCKRKPALSGAMALSTLLLTALAVGGPLVAWQQADLKKQADIATQDARQAETDARKSAKRSADVLQIVIDSFRSANPEEGSNAQMTAKEVLFNASASLNESELDDLGKAELLRILTNSFLGVGEYQSAISTASELLTINKATWGEDHPHTLALMNNLAISYEAAGRREEALVLHEKTLARMKAKLGEDHPDTLMSMQALAISYDSAGRLQEAVELGEKTLALRKSKLGEDHPETLNSMNTLATNYYSAGRLDEALELQEKTFALMKAKLGEDHPDTLNSLNNLANSYYSAGRLDMALELREKTLAQMKVKLGEDHPDTLGSMFNLAISYRAAGRLGEALELQEKTFALMKAKLGEDHPDSLASMYNLAVSYRAAGRLDEALELQEKTFALMKVKLGENHPETLGSMDNLAVGYAVAGRLQEAMELFGIAFARRKSILGVDHADTQASINNLKIVLRKSEKQTSKYLTAFEFDNAEKLLLAMKKYHGTHTDLVRDVPRKLHLVYLAQRKYPDALNSLDDWLGQLDAQKKSDQKLIAWAKTSQSVCYLEQGKLAEAEKTAEDALAMEEINSFNRQRCNSVLGVCLAHQKMFDEAENKVSEACNELEAMLVVAPAGSHWQIPRAAERVIKVYELADKADEVQTWKNKLTEIESRIQKLNASQISESDAETINENVWNKVAR